MLPVLSNFHRRDDRGQMVVIFAMALVTVVVMVGLVLDGGSAFAQRRSQQNAADLAAMAGANTYLLTNDQTAARNAALAVSANNGWTNATGSTSVAVNFDFTNGVAVTVDVTAQHHNNFGSVVGMSEWDVGTSATALAGFPDTAEGRAPVHLQHRRLPAGRGAAGLVREPSRPIRVRRNEWRRARQRPETLPGRTTAPAT